MPTQAEGRTRTSQWIWPILALLGVAVLVGPIVWIAWPRRFVGVPVHGPNGYLNLVAAGRLIRGEWPAGGNFENATTEDLREYLGRNRQAMSEARVGLDRETSVAYPPGATLQTRIDEMTLLRKVSRLLACDAELARREGRTADAADDGLALLKLGRAAGRGGLVIDMFTGFAVETMGAGVLGRVAPTLSDDDARRLISALDRIDQFREPLKPTFARDRAFAFSRGTWQNRVTIVLFGKRMRAMTQPAEAAAQQADLRCRTLVRLAAVTLALRAYRLDHPDAPVPSKLNALVPSYLPAIPADPFGKGPLRLKRTEGGDTRPYSIGPNGRDDGGVSSPQRTSAPASPDDLILEG